MKFVDCLGRRRFRHQLLGQSERFGNDPGLVVEFPRKAPVDQKISLNLEPFYVLGGQAWPESTVQIASIAPDNVLFAGASLSSYALTTSAG